MNRNSTAPVPIGLSEIVTLITLVGSALTALYGRDWGIAANAQHYAGIAVVLLPIGLSIARAIKHHAVTAAASAVAVAAQSSIAAVTHTYTAPSMAEPVADPYPGGDIPAVAPIIIPPQPTPLTP